MTAYPCILSSIHEYHTVSPPLFTANFRAVVSDPGDQDGLRRIADEETPMVIMTLEEYTQLKGGRP